MERPSEAIRYLTEIGPCAVSHPEAKEILSYLAHLESKLAKVEGRTESRKVKFEIVKGVSGVSLYVDNLRVSGPKPWAGGETIYEFEAKLKDVKEAIKYSGDEDERK